MSRTSLKFNNREGLELAALVEKPDQPLRAWAVFAHCFTCSKNIAAAAHISRALAEAGIATLRFDFTGLGNSDGEFANTNFSSNVGDLLAAVDHLRSTEQAPAILIGHSLGGAAVLSAAEHVPEAVAVVTIGAPSSPDHVIENFGAKIDEINDKGSSEVSLGGRSFTIKKQFLEDLNAQRLENKIANLRKALLVFHAPLDRQVSIDEAGAIFTAAKHPKSFVSLDKADHLLTRSSDAHYVAQTIAAWVERYLPGEAETKANRPKVDEGQVLITEHNQRFTRGVYTDQHHWLADEPGSVGGDALGPDPYQHLLASVGACTSMTMRMYANHKKWKVTDIQVTLSHERSHREDADNCRADDCRLAIINREIHIEGDLDQAQHDRLMEIADRCPVHKTLTGDIEIRTAAV